MNYFCHKHKLICSVTLFYFCLYMSEWIISHVNTNDSLNASSKVKTKDNSIKRFQEKSKNDLDFKKDHNFLKDIHKSNFVPKKSYFGVHEYVRGRLNDRYIKAYKIQKNAGFRKHIYMKNYRPIKKNNEINCDNMINNDQNEIEKSKKLMANITDEKATVTNKFYLNITGNCSTFQNERGYINHPLSEDEYKFPLAFSILTYTDVELTERLLRLIYRPHNFYCIHLDPKMSATEQRIIRNIARCLSNVFIANELIDVKWGSISLLEAELSCMKTLWPCKDWKYYLNLAGQEFPLKTNRQIVAILKELDGANVVDASAKKARLDYAKRYKKAKTPPPHDIRLAKGSMHVAANRYFVDFCLHDQRSLDFLDWLKQTEIPDETFFPSLNHNPHLGINGSFLGLAEEYAQKPFFLRFTIWEYPPVFPCKGKFVREVCIIGVEDLHTAYKSNALFVNKFNLNFEHIALDCLEELLYELTWKEYLKDLPVDTRYYKTLDYQKLQLKL